jgi:hypothetical protein
MFFVSFPTIYFLAGKNEEKRKEKKFLLFSLDSLLTDWRLFDLIRLQTSSSPIYTQEREKGPSLRSQLTQRSINSEESRRRCCVSLSSAVESLSRKI